MDFLNASRQMLKDYCEQNNINPEGDKRKASTWRDAAIAFFKSTELSLKELFDKANEIGEKYQDPEHVKAVADELAQIAQEVLGTAAEGAKAIAVQTIEAVTSDKAIAIYQRAAYLMALAVVLVVITVVAIGRTIIEHERTQAGVLAVKVRTAEAGEWIRSAFDREWQSIVNLARCGYLDLME